MKVPTTLIKDFLYSKFGRILIAVVIAFIVYTILSGQLSVENTCKRKANDLVKSLPREIVTNSKILEVVKHQWIEECINEDRQK